MLVYKTKLSNHSVTVFPWREGSLRNQPSRHETPSSIRAANAPTTNDLLRVIRCIRVMPPNDKAQRPPPETPGRLQESLTNHPNRPAAQRGGGSLPRP